MASKNEYKKEWLSRYGRSLCKLKRLEEDLNEYITSFALCKSPLLSDMPQGSHDDAGLERYFPKLEEYKSDIQKQMAECNKIRTEIRIAINNISGRDAETYISLLTYRYMMRWSWTKISEQMCLSYVHVKGYLHGRALEELKI